MASSRPGSMHSSSSRRRSRLFVFRICCMVLITCGIGLYCLSIRKVFQGLAAVATQQHQHYERQQQQHMVLTSSSSRRRNRPGRNRRNVTTTVTATTMMTNSNTVPRNLSFQMNKRTTTAATRQQKEYANKQMSKYKSKPNNTEHTFTIINNNNDNKTTVAIPNPTQVNTTTTMSYGMETINGTTASAINDNKTMIVSLSNSTNGILMNGTTVAIDNERGQHVDDTIAIVRGTTVDEGKKSRTTNNVVQWNPEDTNGVHIQTTVVRRPLISNDNGTSVSATTNNATAAARPRVSRRQQQPPPNNDRDEDVGIRDPLSHTPKSKSITRLPFTPAVPYLGVLVDAGRQYYSIPWLKRLIRYLRYMRFNLIHFRLTDDQAFAVQLHSRPQLAKPSAVGVRRVHYSQQQHNDDDDGHNNNMTNSKNNQTAAIYTPEELRELVDYAHARNITIMPEINVPGHAGAWQLPGLLVPCPNFICSKGYGIPLNIEHPQLLPILRDVITEVTDIFHTSPFLHLGGDEVHMSMPCFHEAGIEMFDYATFEVKLAEILHEVGVQEAVRWEMTGQNGPAARVVSLEHYWLSRRYERDENGTVYPFFASEGLYFDSNQRKDALDIYRSTRDYLTAKDRPMAIVAGAFELGMDTWVDRNVMGRLLAVAMGASGIDFTSKITTNVTANATLTDKRSLATKDAAGDSSLFYSRYFELCKSLAFDSNLCSLFGKPSVSEATYKDRWKVHWNKWKKDICSRLTEGRQARQFVKSGRGHHAAGNTAAALFWEGFAKAVGPPFSEEQFHNSSQWNVSNQPNLSSLAPPFLGRSAVTYRGLSLDLVRGAPDGFTNVTQRLEQIIDVMAELGFNLLHLRIMDDLGFVMKLDPSLNLQRFDGKPSTNYDAIIPGIVEKAFGLGIMVMPEISIISRAGGWSESLAHVQCPNVLCDAGQGLAIDLTQSTSWPILAVAIKRLRQVFSSKFIHLGYDERQESQACYQEAGVTPDFDTFEEKLQEILRIEGIPLEHVVRWENTEQESYAKRAGSVTHYRVSEVGPTSVTTRTTTTNTNTSSLPWFVSTGLVLDEEPESANTTEENAWSIYKHTRSLASKSPTAILASIGRFDSESWTAINMNGRLLAFAMGLQEKVIPSETTFRKHYNRTCQSLTTTTTTTPHYEFQCELFGTTSTAIATKSWWTVRHKQEERRWYDQPCKMRTREFEERIPRKGVLVD